MVAWDTGSGRYINSERVYAKSKNLSLAAISAPACCAKQAREIPNMCFMVRNNRSCENLIDIDGVV
jgi:hypothetical protein